MNVRESESDITEVVMITITDATVQRIFRGEIPDGEVDVIAGFEIVSADEYGNIYVRVLLCDPNSHETLAHSEDLHMPPGSKVYLDGQIAKFKLKIEVRPG